MYHAACKVEFQPFKRSYSQLTFFNFLYSSKLYSEYPSLSVHVPLCLGILPPFRCSREYTNGLYMYVRSGVMQAASTGVRRGRPFRAAGAATAASQRSSCRNNITSGSASCKTVRINGGQPRGTVHVHHGRGLRGRQDHHRRRRVRLLRWEGRQRRVNQEK